MRMLSRGFRGIKAAVQGGYGGRFGGFGRGFAWNQEGIDLRAEAGPRVNNSIVYTAIQRTTIAMLEPDIIVKRMIKGKYETIDDHPITQLLQQPVPWMSGADLRSLWCMAEVLAGNAYCLKHRSPQGKLIGLEYLPLSTCIPMSHPGSGQFIDYYQIMLATGPRQENPENILHTKWHTVNPWAAATAIGPLEAVLPEIAMDNRAAKYEAAVLRNGPKAHLLTPRGQDADGRPLTFGKAQREQIQDALREGATNDSAGSVMAVNFPFDSVELGWSPKDMMLGPCRDVSEERIAAAIGAPLSWLGLGSGLESDSNNATREVTERQAIRTYILPMMKHREKQLTEDLVPELGEPGDIVVFDRRQIAALIDDISDQINMGNKATGGPIMTVNEYRESLGMDPIPGGDVLRNTAGQPAAKFDADEDGE